MNPAGESLAIVCRRDPALVAEFRALAGDLPVNHVLRLLDRHPTFSHCWFTARSVADYRKKLGEPGPRGGRRGNPGKPVLRVIRGRIAYGPNWQNIR